MGKSEEEINKECSLLPARRNCESFRHCPVCGFNINVINQRKHAKHKLVINPETGRRCIVYFIDEEWK